MDMHEQSPLAAIRQKELALAARLASVRHEAAQELASARVWAAQEYTRIEELGRVEAANELRDLIGQADREAAAMLAACEQTTRVQLERGQAILPQATQKILSMVLPKHGVKEARCC